MLGLMTEIGPFIFDSNPPYGILQDDGFGWNKHANLIFLESPAGVGFSKIDNTTVYNYNDTNTASDNYAALQVWFARFKTYQGRDFFISGESYGGMYIPFTAKAVVDGNANSANIKINLKGVLIGNGRINTDPNLTSQAYMKYFTNRNMFDPTTRSILENQCRRQDDSYSCEQAKKTFNQVTEGLNVYNIYGYCYSTDPA